MSSAFADAFATGKKRVVIIGTDCPDINISLIERALDALSQKDLILGPALDGGYYLIGLSRLAPALFDSISWGTGEVLSQTEAIASQLGLNVGFLPALRDVDRPEDLY
jgi:rSAM/selenodomain-associated transferase 1